ncbi:hypothetical protein C8Q77DRAFT_1154306 [Trametes polyzona]|nr:hypothetical protein C8Q77DRAFT_1154306 [Trametes polyzona]
MSSSGPSVLVDDTNPRVQYQPGWIWDQGVVEVDATRHGAAIAGLEAWLKFTGTGVRVVGTLGPSDTNGRPSTTYWIDDQVVGTYSAPFVPSGQIRYNTTFLSIRNLSSGDHTIRINNTDGTSPNVFWLDYFLIDTLAASSPSTVGTIDPQPSTQSGLQPVPTDSDPSPTTSPASRSQTRTHLSTTSSQNSVVSATIRPQRFTVSDNSPLTVSLPGSFASTPTRPPSASSSSASTVKTSSRLSSVMFETDPGFPSPTESMFGSVAPTRTLSGGTTTVVGAANANDPMDVPTSHSHLNTAVVAGAASAAVMALAILAAVALYLRRRRRVPDTNGTAVPFGAPPHGRLSYRSASTGSRTHSPHTCEPMLYSANYDRAIVSTPFDSRHGPRVASLAPRSEFFSTSDSETPSPASSASLLVSPRRNPSPSTAHITLPSDEKPHATDGALTHTSPNPTLIVLPDISDIPRTLRSPTSPVFSESAPSVRACSSPIPPAAVIPPGEWHAPPGEHSRAHALLRNLFSRGHRASSASSDSVRAARDVDSGLRLYDNVVLPPPYTQD